MNPRRDMRFLADMGLDVRVVDWLREQGHDAKHLREEGLHRLANGLIFEKAVAEDRIVLAFDLDFGEIAALVAGRKASVILFRLHIPHTDGDGQCVPLLLSSAHSEGSYFLVTITQSILCQPYPRAV